MALERPETAMSSLSVAASTVLEKVKTLHSAKERLEGRVRDLETELRRLSNLRIDSGVGSAALTPTSPSRAQSPRPMLPEFLEPDEAEVNELQQRLRDCGVHLPRRKDLRHGSVTGDVIPSASSRPRRRKGLEDLKWELDSGASVLHFEDGKVVRLTEVLQINLVVEVQGRKYILIERDRFDVSTGRRRNLKLPMRKKMKVGADWRTQLTQAVEQLLNLPKSFQDAYLRIEEGSHTVSQVEPATCDLASEYPMFQTRGTLHEVSVRLTSLEDILEQSLLQEIGLPSCCDFVTSALTSDGRDRVHVWCWRHCDEARDLELANFEHFLKIRGIDVSQFGRGTMKSLSQLYAEVFTHKESSVIEDVDGELIRTLSLVQIKVVVEVYRQKKMLISSEQYLDDGRRRKVSQLLVHKLRAGETWREVLPRAFQERLGVPRSVYEECFELKPDSERHEESVRWSSGYPMRTRYQIANIEFTVRDPRHPGLAELGLPRGNSFISREGNLGNNQQGRLHVWSWVPDTSEEEDLQLVGSAIEEICQELHEAENLVQQTSKHAESANMGLEAPLEQALAKIQKALKSIVKIDASDNHVDVNRMFKSSKHFAGKGSLLLAEFISSNFTRSVQNPEDTSFDNRTMSRDVLPDLRMLTNFQELSDDRILPGGYQAIRQNIGKFGFNILELVAQCTSTPVLQLYGEIVLGPYVSAVLKSTMDACCRFLKSIESTYNANPYHNAVHAVQVCHGGVWLTRAIGLAKNQRALERVAVIIASLCHDMKHFGRNNAFCINSGHALAILYNDSRVLENMHTAACFQALNDEGAGALMSNVRAKDKQPLRAMIIELILSTDMSEHFQAISKSRMRRESPEFSFENEADRRFVAQMCLKGGDIGHSGLPWDAHLHWSALISQEFFSQGDEERRLGLPVSALCDRAMVVDLGKSQRGFIEFVCLPLFEELECVAVPGSSTEDELDAVPEDLDSCCSARSNSSRGSIGRDVREFRSVLHSSVHTIVVKQLRLNADRWTDDPNSKDSLEKLLRQEDSRPEVDHPSGGGQT